MLLTLYPLSIGLGEGFIFVFFMQKSTVITFVSIGAIIAFFVIAIGFYAKSKVAEGGELLACVRSDKYASLVDEHVARGRDIFAVNSTPSNALINTQTREYMSIPGAVSEAAFTEIIDVWSSGDSFPFSSEIVTGSVSEDIIAILRGEMHYSGSSDAPYLIVEFSDPECPACALHYVNGTLETLAKDRDDIAVVYQHFPLSFHTYATNAVYALECAQEIGGDEAYKKLKDKIYNYVNDGNKPDLATISLFAKELEIGNNE